jgi:hypothetical protein
MKKLMAQEETMVPNLFYNLKRALVPLMHDDTYAAMSAVTRMIETTGLNPRNRPPQGSGGSASHNKRPSRDQDATEMDVEVEAKRAKVAPAEEGAEGSDEEGEPSGAPACGADGGYCPPCYELA